MIIIKSYTDLEQSKRLAEILPIESSDMCWTNHYYGRMRSSMTISAKSIYEYKKLLERFADSTSIDVFYPAWSLAALMSVLRVFTIPTAFSVKVSTPSLIKTENGYKLTYIGDYTPMINNGLDIETPIESVADNPIDACVNMIIKLKEGGLL